jgi:hypothetical protein
LNYKVELYFFDWFSILTDFTEADWAPILQIGDAKPGECPRIANISYRTTHTTYFSFLGFDCLFSLHLLSETEDVIFTLFERKVKLVFGVFK